MDIQTIKDVQQSLNLISHLATNPGADYRDPLKFYRGQLDAAIGYAKQAQAALLDAQSPKEIGIGTRVQWVTSYGTFVGEVTMTSKDKTMAYIVWDNGDGEDWVEMSALTIED